jgi:uncharacterized protein YjiS (DUF1127 family)
MFLAIILSSFRQWLRTRETVRELASLTDRELSDIGLNRGEIPEAARKAL